MSDTGTRTCGMCGRKLRFGEESVFTSPDFTVLRCSDCGGVRKMPWPSDDELQEARRLLREIIVWTMYDDPLAQFMLMQVRNRIEKYLQVTER